MLIRLVQVLAIFLSLGLCPLARSIEKSHGCQLTADGLAKVDSSCLLWHPNHDVHYEGLSRKRNYQVFGETTSRHIETLRDASFAISTGIEPIYGELSQATSCEAGVLGTGEALTSKYGVDIFNITRRKLDEGLSPYPNSEVLTFVLYAYFGSTDSREKTSHTKALNLLNSPKARLALASSVLSSCANVSIVNFALMNSDFIQPTYRMPNGLPMNGVPVPCRKGLGNLEWGFFESC